MGLNISLPNVYEEPIQTKYRAASPGATLLEVVSLLSVLILPFIIGLEMGQFWKLHDVVSSMPAVAYSDKCLLKVSMSDGGSLLWASSPTLQSMLDGDVRQMAPFVSLLADDRDGDGHVDEFAFRVEVPLDLKPGVSVQAFEFLPAFQYHIDDSRLRVKMETAPLVSFFPPAGTTGVNVLLDGVLSFRQMLPLQSSTYIRYDRVYNVTLFDLISDVNDLSNIGEVASRYARRNESAVFEPRVTSFGPPKGVQQFYDPSTVTQFTATILMRVQPVAVDYVPSFGEVIKYGWIQYFCIAYVVHWFFFHVRRIFVKQAFIDTVALWEGRRP